MNPTHTPGPWIVRHLTGFPLMIATAPDGDGFGEPVADCSRHHLPAQAMCNARLIAAAPELLTMLTRVMDEVMMDEAVFSKLALLTLKQARDAINKAKGSPA